MKPSIAIAALVLASIATPSAAQAPSDAACVLVSNLFAARSSEAAQKKLAENALYYYFGKLDARMSSAQIQAAMKQAGPSISAKTAGPLMTDCARNMTARAAAFQNATAAVRPALPATKK